MKQIKIVIADDSRFFVDALANHFSDNKKIDVVATFIDLNELIKYTNNAIFDVLVLDINFKGVNSLDYIDKIRPEKKSFKIISLTSLNNSFMKRESLKKQVDVFVGKDSDIEKFEEIIVNSLSANNQKKEIKTKIHFDKIDFTDRKIEILKALYKHSDKTSEQIAEILNITENSLKSHKRQLFEMTNTQNTTDLVKYGIQKGLII
ncbi:response regulator transcription factor [Polaribacter aestuariivivens]|uniref:Response regulator transcription factor n=1 Tax=Polaribacter aestuariivivens TaxID=2304626 RepID=A0A5S3N705_9FLAO|nr:response regulator transcription factor [Polaribacter aestuariivivens]TMM31095.1 response regulator transcription factor [Polaribacter aestuariivivens]